MSHRTRYNLIAASAGAIAGSATLLAASVIGSALPTKPDIHKLDYTRDIRPILAEKCFACHGLDDKKRQAGLRLDTREGAFGTAPSGHTAIVPGKPASSQLVSRITAHDGTQMPPAGSGKKLTPQEIETLKKWVAQGAPYAAHWAFVKPSRPAVPAIQNPKSKIPCSCLA